jgi:hypothetical protein
VHRPPISYSTQSGTIEAEVRTNAVGEVFDARIVSGPEQLRAAVLRSLLDWHFSRDFANATRTVTITVSSPARIGDIIPQQLEGNLLSPGTADQILNINILGLAEPQREDLLRRLPAHAGDTLTPERREAIAKAILAVDEHLTASASFGILSITGPPGSVVPDQPELGRLGPDAAEASLISKVAPLWPPSATGLLSEGTVMMQAIIGTDGRVRSLSLVSGPPMLSLAVTQAVAQWVYRPYLLNGRPAEVATTIVVPLRP